LTDVKKTIHKQKNSFRLIENRELFFCPPFPPAVISAVFISGNIRNILSCLPMPYLTVSQYK